ncbi:14403_t:CDS:10 [Gigaspora margarita]|uniref:14403_t:CDS:1 n=1 Tax=Gigaspora margarita TaxID=4874 RepID=A0ABN7UHH2_GIGMA|nr:14403_t:CDS:10 [Gigaspora margarita]
MKNINEQDNEEIIKASINLIWKATDGKVVTVTFNDPIILSAKIALDNGTSMVINLDVPKAVLLNEDNYRKLRTELTGKGSITIDVEEIEEFDADIEANVNRIESDIAETAQQEGDRQINNFFKVSKKNQNVFKNPLNYERVDDNQQEESNNCDHEINEETDGSVSSNMQSVNNVANMLEQATLPKNASGNHQEEDIDVIEDESPEWSECEHCYGSKKEYCEFYGCSICKWKGDLGCILLCDGCEKGFHTSCLKPPLKRIPAGKWYCNECKTIKKSLRKDSSSKKTKSNHGKRARYWMVSQNESTGHANDNMVKGINFPIVFIDNECISIRQQTNEIANVPIIQLDINTQQTDEIENAPVIQSDDHEENMSNEDNMSFEDSQSLQPDQQNEAKNYADINGDLVPITIPFIIVTNQETGEKRKEINPEANKWNREFSQAIIKNEMVAARRLLILVQRLGWFVIYNNESISPSRVRRMSKKEWSDLIKKIEEKEPDSLDYYKLSDESLKELEESI